MSLSCFRSKQSFGAAVLLLGLTIGGCVSKACPDGQKLQSGKCVAKMATAANRDPDSGRNPTTEAGVDASTQNGAMGDSGPKMDVAADASIDAGSTDATRPACLAVLCWRDEDHDGFAPSKAGTMNVPCDAKCPDGWTTREPAADDIDCVDDDASFRPMQCWVDSDKDGYAADDKDQAKYCSDQCPSGWTAVEPKKGAVDCSETSRYLHPGANETCDGMDDDCDDKVDEGADNACVEDNASALCVDGMCKIGQCDNGFGDCNKSYVDGCEEPLNTVDACGGCGMVCDPLATCDETGTPGPFCNCQPPSFGPGSVCHALGPISAGWRATCATDGSNDASCWGVSSTATDIPHGKYRQLAIGPTVGCGITAAGALRCWGATIVPDDAQFIQVVVGNDYVCALTAGQYVICWGVGSNPAAYGEASPPADKFDQLAGGFYHVCGLRSYDGQTVCWGAGSYERTADCGATGYDCGQGQPPADDRFVQLGAGMVHTCGLKADGSVKCWGAGVTSGTEASALKYGQTVPPTDEHFAWISTGYLHNCGIRQSDSKVVCWGAGQASGSSGYDQHQSVPTDDSFLVLSAGLFQTCGLTTDRAIVCWGSRTDGAPASVDGSWPLNPGR